MPYVCVRHAGPDSRAPNFVPVSLRVGYTLSHRLVYKFRQRFGIVADAICRGLGRDTKAAVEVARKMNMYLDDLKCCEPRW